MKNFSKIIFVQISTFLISISSYSSFAPNPKTPFFQSEGNLHLIKVGSYNIKKQELFDELTKDFEALKSIEVFGLQEVLIDSSMNSDEEYSLKSITKKYWPFQCLVKVNQESKKIWEGQVVLSRLPLIKCGHFDLEATGTKKRVAQWAVVEFSKDKFMLFVNTDHETNTNLTLGFPDRRKQILSLIDGINSCGETINPKCLNWTKVIVGDFNTSGISITSPISTFNEISKTEDLMRLHKFDRIQPCPDQEATFSSVFGSYELDHIFTHQARITSCRETAYDFLGSDHFPIWFVVKA